MLLPGIAEEGEKLLLLPATGIVVLPETKAGEISFRPKFSKLLETLFMFSGATLAPTL